MDGDGVEAAGAMAQRAVAEARAVGRREGMQATVEEDSRHRLAETILRAMAGADASAAQSAGFAPGAQAALASSAQLYRDLAETYRTAEPGEVPALRSPEQVAEAFHVLYEALAPESGYETRAESAVPWAGVPEANKSLMIATVSALMERGVIRPGPASSAGEVPAEAESETAKVKA